MKKSLLITGAAGGIGSAVVKELHSKEWSIIGLDHPSILPDPSISKLCVEWRPLDLIELICNEKARISLFETIQSISNSVPLCAIIHNAAHLKIDTFHKISIEEWQKTFAINLFAPIEISKLFLYELSKNKGSIIHISSIHANLTKPGFCSYATSKAALNGLTNAMAVELGEEVRVNAIEPNENMRKYAFRKDLEKLTLSA